MLSRAGSPNAVGDDRPIAIANLCAEFVNGWKSGERPRIEVFLEQVSAADRPMLLSRLIALEVTCRRGLGESPSPAEFSARFPAERPLIDAVLLETDQTSQVIESTRDVEPGELPDSNADFAFVGEQPALLAGGEMGEAPGRFQRVELLGRGGFGEVWRARDSRLGREVALKVPRPDKSFPPEIHRKFLAEARKVAALDSIPGIVRVFDVGATAAGFCIVMQLIDGESLAARLDDPKRPRLTHRESAQLIAEIATALDEVHRHRDSITHRDLKPGNILLDKKGRPHITDFGLAVSEMEQLGEGRAQQGTKAYLSPEQARFESNLVDGRSDIFSLGVVFYELLTGVRPFAGRTTEECVKAILESEPRPLRARDATIPRELERICLKCLEKRMSARYLTAGDLADELKAWLNSSGTGLAEHSSTSVAYQPVPARRQSRRVVTGLAATVFLATLALLAYRALEPPSRTEREFIKVFGQRPRTMSWEGKRGRGAPKFVDESNLSALEITSETVWLVELCEMPAGDFEFSIELRQPSGPGRVGIFLGKHLEEQGARHLLCDTFQLIRLHYRPAIPDLSPAQFRIERQKAYIDSPNSSSQSFAAAELGTQPIDPPWETAKPRLEITVRNRRLTRVVWNGREISELVADVWEKKLTPEDYKGPLGIYVESTSVWCSKPELKLLPGEGN